MNKILAILALFLSACSYDMAVAIQPVEIASVAATQPTEVLAIETEALAVESSPGAVSVKIVYESVNIRDGAGAATGTFAERGQVLVVHWQEDGWGVIASPSKWHGMTVWRGCTSDPGEYGCEAQ